MNNQNNFLFPTDLSENTELSLTYLLEKATILVKDVLQQFVNEPDFTDKMQLAFGENTDGSQLRASWQAGEFIFPQIEIVNATDLNGANGAFARDTNKIYLAQEFLLANQSDIDVVAAVLLEEYGHSVDSEINSVDAPGDEGAIFAALVQGEKLDESELQLLRNEDDRAVVIIAGEVNHIEQALSATLSPSPGTADNPTIINLPPDPDDADFNYDFAVIINYSYVNDTGVPVLIFGEATGPDSWSNGSPRYDTDNDPTTNPGYRNASGTNTYTLGVDSPGELFDITLYMTNEDQSLRLQEISIPGHYLYVGDGDLAISKSNISAPAIVDDIFTYEINVVNNGPYHVQDNVVIEETLPEGVDIVGSNYPYEITQNNGNQIIEIDVDSLSVNYPATVIVEVIPTIDSRPDTSSSLDSWNLSTNTNLLVPSSINDTNLSNNQIQQEIEVINPPIDLKVEQTDLYDPVYVGEELTYVLTVTNQGNQEAKDVRLVDNLPQGVEFVQAITSNDSDPSRNKVIDPTLSSNGTVLGNNVASLDFILGNIPSGESALVNITVIPTVDSRPSSANSSSNQWQIINNATVSLSPLQTDANPNNDQTSETTEVIVPELSLNDISASEGDNDNTNFNFTVSLSQASWATVTVDYASADGNGIAGEDYIATSGTLTFAPGETQKTIAVEVVGDTELESDETFNVNLSNPVNSAIANSLGIGTIQNDDIPPTPLTVPQIQVNSKNKLAIKLDSDINPDSLNLYRGGNNRDNPPDITLVGEKIGTVKGSLVWDELTKTVTFIATKGILEPDNYTLTIPSREDGIVTKEGGVVDGNNDGIGGDDYVYEFTIEESRDRILSIPDLTLAPGVTTDIPVTLDNVEGITKLEFDFYYDTDLLDITAINSNDNLPASWQLAESEIDRDNGIINVTIEGTDALTGDNLNIVNLEATVPDPADYGETQILDLANVVLNDGNVSAADDDGIHQVIQAGDTTGDGTLSGLDAYQMMRVSVGLDDGFDRFSSIDPIISADMNEDGVISAFDAYHAVNG
ncbi:MAG: Calx-beta domain-containing protein [Xenococcaceae cyanobacterium MO_188.B19]|nr:Calx-beta domain-containing protein [Xenococcaceae cyanobacterium MO_188.B19]